MIYEREKGRERDILIHVFTTTIIFAFTFCVLVTISTNIGQTLLGAISCCSEFPDTAHQFQSQRFHLTLRYLFMFFFGCGVCKSLGKIRTKIVAINIGISTFHTQSIHFLLLEDVLRFSYIAAKRAARATLLSFFRRSKSMVFFLLKSGISTFPLSSSSLTFLLLPSNNLI